MKKMNSKEIVLLEDHHESYYAWEERGFRNLPLVHLDAHIDFGFQEVKDEKLILQEAKSLAELKTQLEKAMLFRKYKFKKEKLTDIGNYIYPAIRDGIVSEFFWIIPGRMSEFKKCLVLIKKMLKGFKEQDPFACESVSFEPGFIKTKLYNKPLYICILETLPVIKNQVLLDIDIDFLVIDSLKNAEVTANVGKRKPWITPEELVQVLEKKMSSTRFITIAYSVNGGFTPMVYKTEGDQIARCFGHSDPDLEGRIHAGEYFKSFRAALDKEDFKTAKRYYLQALKMNPKYKELDNNYGPLYLMIEDYAQAEKEFRAILKVDKEDSYCLSGLGRICLVKKRFMDAKDYFKKALTLRPDNKTGLLGLSEVEFKLKNYSSAKSYIARYENLEPMQGFSRYLLGQIYEKENNPREALAKYKEALQIGLNNIDLFVKLVKLSRRFDKANLDYLKKRFADYKKSFYEFKRKSLKKKGKLAKIKQIEEKIKKLSASLSL